MIDAHLHLGSIPFKGKNGGNFIEYKKIAKKVGIEKYCLVPIGLPKILLTKQTPDNNSVLNESKKKQIQ